MDSECPSVLVYDEEGTELYESNLLTHPQLVSTCIYLAVESRAGLFCLIIVRL